MTAHPEALHDAVSQLDAAVDRMFGPQTTAYGPTASLWTQMVEAIHDRPTTGNKRQNAPGVNANLDAIDWCNTVERTVKQWAGIDDDPQTILDGWCDPRAWRPQDAPIAADHARTIHGWCRKAQRLLGGYSVMTVNAPCPECGRLIYHDHNIYGERVRKPALEVDTSECRCNICGTTWPPDQYAFLARVIGATPPEEIA